MLRFFLLRKINAQKNSKSSSRGRHPSRNRRIYHRFPIEYKHLTLLNEQDILVVRDLSAKGFSCFVSEQAYHRFQIGDQYSGKIRYVQEIYKIEVHVKWKSDGHIVGFTVAKADTAVFNLFRRLLKPIEIGSSMYKIDSEFMREHYHNKTWYHAEDDTDLYIWQNDAEGIYAWQLIMQDKFLEWKNNTGLSSGFLTVEETHDSDYSFNFAAKSRDNKKLVAHYEPTVNPTTLTFGRDLLLAANIDEQELILEHLAEEH